MPSCNSSGKRRSDAALPSFPFAGRKCHAIIVDRREFRFAEQDTDAIGWTPVARDRRIAGGAVIQIHVSGTGRVRIPAEGLPEGLGLYTEGAKPGSRGQLISSHRENGTLVFSARRDLAGRWLYGVAEPA